MRAPANEEDDFSTPDDASDCAYPSAFRRLAMRASRSMRCEPIHDYRSAARLAAPEPDHFILGNLDREGKQFLDFKFGPREAPSIRLVCVTQALSELQRQQLSPRDARRSSEPEQSVDAAKHREDGTFAARSRGVSEPPQ